MTKWTNEQLQAITARNSAVLVSAAAGSGKTTVLVERILRMLSNREEEIPADRMIVVTFTNDAAAEMKQRLLKALSLLIEEQPENQWLFRQQMLLQTAKISTIHSFCFDLIRDNLKSLELSSGFRIMDDAEEKLLLQSSVRKAMEICYQNNSEIMNTLLDFFCVKGDRVLEEQLLSLYRFLVSIPYYWDWIERQILLCNSEREEWLQEYQKYLIAKFAGFAQSAIQCHERAEALDCPGAAELIESEAMAFMETVKTLLNEELSWDEKISRASRLSFDRISYGISKDDVQRKAEAEKISKLRTNYKDQYKKLISEELFTEEEIRDDLFVHQEILRDMVFLLHLAEEELKKKKKEKNALGFSDAEQLAVMLLSEKQEDGTLRRSKLAKELSEYYKVIMIDEFQDANTNQDLIFKLLSYGGSPTENGSNMFLVGDVKQSIYRFRLANPSIFVKTLKESKPYDEKQLSLHSSVLLNQNFRSCKEVVEFVNFIFRGIMSQELGEIDYAGKEELVAGAEFPDGDRTPEILMVSVPEEKKEDTLKDNQENKEQDEDSEENSQSDKENFTEVMAEAEAVAKKIHSMLSEKRSVYEKGVLRPCMGKDFCILLRNKASGIPFMQALLKYGIKAHIDEVDGYLKSREISVLLNFLQVIDNPLMDIPMTSVLMSPMFSFTAEEMAILRLQNKKATVYGLLLEAEQGEDMPETLKNKVSYFLSSLREFRRLAAVTPPQKLIRTIYEKTGFLSVIQMYQDGEKKKANLRLLLEYARAYEESSDGGLTGFIRYIRNVSAQGGDFKQAGISAQADDVVSVKTIHKSKGLEYPFVFLCRLSKEFNMTDLGKQVQMDQELGIGLRIQSSRNLKKYPSLPFTAIREKSRRNSLSEEMRLLYVALTRAKEGLFLTLNMNEKTASRLERFAAGIAFAGGTVTPSLAAEAKSMQDWLLMMMLLHPDGGYFRKLSDASINPVSTNSRVKVFAPDCENRREEAEGAPVEKAVPDKNLVEKLEKQFGFIYQRSTGVLPAKLTVSELSHPQMGEILLSRPRFLQEERAFTGAERGTATHTFMQYADFLLAEKSVSAEISRLVEKGHLTPRQGEAVLIPPLERFFRSELYARIKGSSLVEREKKFLISFEDLGSLDEQTALYQGTDGMLQGIADCVFHENGGLILLDYKTDSVKTPEELVKRYRRQLELYRAAMEKLCDLPVREGLLYSFSLGQTVKVL